MYEEESISPDDQDMDEDKQTYVQTKIINEEEELKPEVIGVFFRKEDLLETSIPIRILELSTGKFGRNIKFKNLRTEQEWLMDLNKTNYNWLLENVGTSVKAMKEQTIILQGEAFSEVNKRTKENLQGVKVSFALDN